MKHLPAIALTLSLLTACSSAPTVAPAPTADVAAIQTRAVSDAFATQTASAPTATLPPTVDVNAIETQAARSVHATETASAPTSTVTPVATSTPLILATSTEAAPAFQRWTSQQVVVAFRSSGLEVGSPVAMTKQDYGLAPMVAVEATHFFIPSLCSDCGGRIFSFASPSDLETTRAYYVKLGQSSALFFSWTFVKDNILVAINGDLPEAKAKAYEAALQGMH